MPPPDGPRSAVSQTPTSASQIEHARDIAPDLRTNSKISAALVRDREGFIASRCRAEGLIAHLGCTDSPYTEHRLATKRLLHERLLQVDSGVVGFDIDRTALGRLQAAWPSAQFVWADIAQEVPTEWRHRFALVIAGEVLEHVPNAGDFLVAARSLLAPGGHLLVTVPNACSPKIGLRSLLGRESVHPDHHTYYGPRTLQHALRCAGYEPEVLASYLATPGPLGRLVNVVLRLAHRLTGGPVGEGLIALARAGVPPERARDPPDAATTRGL